MTLHPHNIHVSHSALDAHATIFSGQLFRFRLTDASTIVGVQGQNVIEVHQTPNSIRALTSHPEPETYLRNFLVSIP